MAGEDARRIAADAEEGGMAEGDEPAQPEREVEADRGQRQDRHARGQRDVEGLRRCCRRTSGIGEQQQRQQRC